MFLSHNQIYHSIAQMLLYGTWEYLDHQLGRFWCNCMNIDTYFNHGFPSENQSGVIRITPNFFANYVFWNFDLYWFWKRILFSSIWYNFEWKRLKFRWDQSKVILPPKITEKTCFRGRIPIFHKIFQICNTC